MLFDRFRIGTRLGAALSALLLLTVVMLCCALWQLNRIADGKNTMAATSYKAKLATQWLQGIATNSVRTMAKVKSTDPEDEQRYTAEMKDVSTRVSALQKELESLVSSDKGKQLLRDVGERRKQYSAMRDEAFKRKTARGAADAELKAYVVTSLVPAMKDYV